MKVKGSLAKLRSKGYLLIGALDLILDGWIRLQSKERGRRHPHHRPVAAMAGANGSPEILVFTVSDHQLTHG
jgi:hypothetical protein